MRRPSRTGLSWLFVVCANMSVTAQNFDAIGRERPVSLSGGISFNQIFYASGHPVSTRRDPYSYFATGNVNLSLYGWSIPLSFTLSNHKTSFSQPFNQYGIHPRWKWITGHAGYISMSYSPYTVNGHIFRGAAIDLEPDGPWKASFFYGRLIKAVQPDYNEADEPAYQRYGYGFKTSVGNGANFVDMIVFGARDYEDSIMPPPDSLGVKPLQNLVLSVGAGKSLFSRVSVKAEIASSALTKDTRAATTEHKHLLTRSPALFRARLSSAYYQAFRTSLNYQYETWMAGVAYERIDPGYRTLGAYYFNNDLENVTLNGSGTLDEGKFNVAVSAGLQRDNIDKAKISTMRRMVGSVNMTYTPSQRLNLSASWSSFQTYTNIRSAYETAQALTPYDNLDTLNFTQISRNASLSGMYTLSADPSSRQHLQLNLSWQDAADKQGENQQHAGTRFYNINSGYVITLAPQDLSISVSWNTSLNSRPFMNTRMSGPSASVSRSFLRRKLRTSLSSSYNRTRLSNSSASGILNARLNAILTMLNKHNVSVNAVMVNRSGREGSPDITEFTATVGYNYTFSTKDKRRSGTDHSKMRTD